MKTNILIACILLITLLNHALAGNDCDCTKVPYDPPECFKFCAAKALAKASKSQLVETYKLSDTTAQKIVSFKDRESAASIDDYKKVLTPGEMKSVVERFKASQRNLDQANKPDPIVPSGDGDKNKEIKESKPPQ